MADSRIPRSAWSRWDCELADVGCVYRGDSVDPKAEDAIRQATSTEQSHHGNIEGLLAKFPRQTEGSLLWFYNSSIHLQSGESEDTKPLLDPEVPRGVHDRLQLDRLGCSATGVLGHLQPIYPRHSWCRVRIKKRQMRTEYKGKQIMRIKSST